ncbi:MAG TPA: hypothetical protein VFT43_01800 [Candidatus Polarisedimenticolia bacterium]|nr:hypothetical protein [Candidatus Polarisedimenticolia bacterium]
MTEIETIALLVELLEKKEPFCHVRFGDGDVFFATGTGPRLTADGEEWSPELQQRLFTAWLNLWRSDVRLLLGDLETYVVSDGCEEEWRHLLITGSWQRRDRPPPELVHMEALRAGFGHAIPLYRALRDDPRRKLFVGSEALESAAAMLGADYCGIPLRTSSNPHAVNRVCLEARNYEVACFAAGRGGKIMQASLANSATHLTQIDIGSGLDILFGGARRGTDGGVDVDRLKRDYREAGLLK